MSDHLSKQVSMSFEGTVEKVKNEIEKGGFAVFCETDVIKTHEAKLETGFNLYKIIGAYSPISFYRALQRDKNIGVLLPFNFMVQQDGQGTRVSVEDPTAITKVHHDEKIAGIFTRIQKKLQKIIEAV
ncbi:MAG: DUF302 domain-containing protein [Actinobacteria bacterium]|nr:DUF302 domain-containing protein [Actinomycetota bacterium]